MAWLTDDELKEHLRRAELAEIVQFPSEIVRHILEELSLSRTRIAKYEAAVEALEQIAAPVSYLKKHLVNGEKINGLMAVKLSNDPYYLKGIAIKALAALKEDK